MPVPFAELEGSPTITIEAHATRAVRVFRVAWADWQEFARELAGGWKRVGGVYEPVAPKAFPGLPDVVIEDIQIAPFDPGNPDGSQVQTISRGTNAYPHAGAKVTATYLNRPADEDDESELDIPRGTTLTFSSDLGGEYVTFPGRAYHWSVGGDKLPPDVNPGVFMPTGAYTLHWDRVASPPWNVIRAARGKINHAPFQGAEAGKVLFLGARASRQFEFLQGVTLWSLEYSFAERAEEWNKFFRVETGQWTEIVPQPYAPADFNQLFTFA